MISASSVSLFGYFVTVVQRVFVLTSQVMLLLVCGVDGGGVLPAVIVVQVQPEPGRAQDHPSKGFFHI